MRCAVSFNINTLRGSTDNQDAAGHVTNLVGTPDVRTVEIVPLTGAEAVHAQQLKAHKPYQIRLRAQGLSITPQHSITWGSRIFQIVSVTNVGERGEWYEILATERL
jgi:head-tail adaptor